jgi:hypothetical protein
MRKNTTSMTTTSRAMINLDIGFLPYEEYWVRTEWIDINPVEPLQTFQRRKLILKNPAVKINNTVEKILKEC